MQSAVERLIVQHDQLDKDFHEFEADTKSELRALQDKVTALETRTTVNERDIQSVIDRLTKIDNNTTWILRLLLGALATGSISGVIGLFFWFLQGSLGGK